MSLESFIRAMPKVELHVHLVGAMRPATLLALSKRNNIPLPESSLDGVSSWMAFRDFPHFIEVYTQISRMVLSADDIELVAREFLEDQARHNILHTEVTFTAYGNHFLRNIPIEEQLAALGRARDYGRKALGVSLGIVLDIPRERTSEQALVVADWAIRGRELGVVALGLGGDEANNPAERFAPAFDRAHDAGLPCVPHAGEVEGPDSIWSALKVLHATRIDHGVTCMQDAALVAELRDRKIALDVCPSSNVRLGIAPSIEEHPLRRMFEAGLNVTIGSDDPPMFNTTLTDEYLAVCKAYGWGVDEIERLSLNAVHASLLPDQEMSELEQRVGSELVRLRVEHGIT